MRAIHAFSTKAEGDLLDPRSDSNASSGVRFSLVTGEPWVNPYACLA